jgi:hypothetical protein
MKRVTRSIGLTTVLAILSAVPAQAQSSVYIEYSVTGSAAASGRDGEVVLCSQGDDGFNIHSLGSWIFSIDAPSAEPGEHEAKLRVAAPDDVAALHDDSFRTDDRLYGDGTIVIERAGTGQANLPLLRVRFTGKGLASDTGAKIDVEGTLVCALM